MQNFDVTPNLFIFGLSTEMLNLYFQYKIQEIRGYPMYCLLSQKDPKKIKKMIRKP